MRNFQPHTTAQDERKITRLQGDLPGARNFGEVYNDGPGSSSPGLYDLVNYRSFINRLLPRGGSQIWSATTHAAGNVNCVFRHKRMNKTCVHIGTSLYITDAITISYIEAIKNAYNAITDGASTMEEVENWLFIYDSTGYIFKVDLQHSVSGSTTISATDPYVYYQVNTRCPTALISDVAKSATLVYGRKYTYGMVRLQGVLTNDRSTPLTIELQSGSNAPSTSTRLDFGTVYTSKPVGDAYNASHSHYGTLTGGDLPIAYDAASEWAALANATFTISINGTSRNVGVDCTGCKTMDEVAAKIQSGLQTAFPGTSVTCVYSTATNDHFIITSPNIGGTVSVTTAGVGGTDVGSAGMSCQTGAGGGTVDDANDYYMASPIGSGVKLFTIPSVPAISYKYPHWTHYALYATKDIGKYGIDPETGKGNNSELFIWVADIPVAKCTLLKRTEVGVGYYTVVSTSPIFSIEDLTTNLGIWNGAMTVNYSIVGFTDSTHITIFGTAGAGNDATDVWGAIGGGTIINGSQAGNTFTTASGTAPTANDIGKMLFYHDGTYGVITAVAGANCTVYPSKALAAGSAVTYNPSSRKFNDTISDDVLSTRVNSEMVLMNRYYEELPLCDTGIYAHGFLFGSLRSASNGYYSPMPDGKQYLGGYYRSDAHVFRTEDKIKVFTKHEGFVGVVMANTTKNIPVNTFITKQIKSSTGVVVDTLFLISAINDVSKTVGCVDYTSVVEISKDTYFMITNDGAARTFNGGGYSDNLAFNKYSKKIKSLLPGYTVTSYDEINGVIIWGKNTTAGTIPNVCYCLAIKPEQGIGWSSITGTSWPWPNAKTGVITITDTYNNVRQLVLDNATKQFISIDSRDGSTGSGLSKTWKDSIAVAGTGGADIVPYFITSEDRGTFEHHWIEHKGTHIYCRPYSESAGYTSGFYLDVSFFKDGEPTTPAFTADNIHLLGEVVSDKKVEANRIQVKVAANMGNHIIVGRFTEYVAKDLPADSSYLVSTEADNQAEFAEPDVWADVLNGKVIDRVDNSTLIASPTTATGIDGNTSAWTISAACNLGSTTLGASGTLLIWALTASVISVTIGGTAVVLATHGTSGLWTLYYANTVGLSGALVITPTGNATIMNIRAYNSGISVQARTYYFADLTGNSGNIMMAR